MSKRLVAIAAAVGALTIAPAADAAKPLTIKGKIQGAGTAGARVIALSRTGVAVTAPVTGNRFTLVIPGNVKRKGMTVNLVGRTGRYLGPIVLARKARAKGVSRLRQGTGGTGYQALSAGASGTLNLGTVGFARGAGTPQVPVPAAVVDTAAGVPLDGAGKPLGAGENGLQRMPNGGNDGAFGADPDRDGVVNAFDQDQNGNLLLNQQDQKTVDAIQRVADHPWIFSSLFVPYPQAIQTADFAANVRNLLAVSFGYNTPTPDAYSSMSVDCLGIPWCAAATVKTDDYTDAAGTPFGRDVPWPLLAGTDRHVIGFRRGNMVRSFDIAVLPNTPPSGLVVGQTFAFHAVKGGTETVSMLALGPYFSAPPVPTRIGTTDITSTTTLGTMISPIPVSGTKVEITILRPLRPAIPGAEAGTSISMGKLNYGVDVYPTGVAAPPAFCPPGAFSGLSATLGPNPARMGTAPLTDAAPDAQPSPDRTVTFTVDLAQCGSTAVTPGATVAIDVFASDATGSNANAMGIILRLQ